LSNDPPLESFARASLRWNTDTADLRRLIRGPKTKCLNSRAVQGTMANCSLKVTFYPANVRHS
jgi:hypothetical protein